MVSARRLCVVAAVAWLGLAGCGSDYDPSGPTFTLLYTGAVGGHLAPCG